MPFLNRFEPFQHLLCSVCVFTKTAHYLWHQKYFGYQEDTSVSEVPFILDLQSSNRQVNVNYFT